MASTLQGLLTLSIVLVLLLVLPNVHAQGRGRQSSAALPSGRRPNFMPGPWKDARATFYDAGDGTGRPGACGYGGTTQDLRFQTTALSTASFINGQTCGACYEVKCAGDQNSSKPGQPSIFVTATDLCPDGGWCSQPLEHFDLAQPAFLQIAEYKAGVVPVQYRRVPCRRQGGIRFTIEGNPYFNLVTVWNVGGAGDVTTVQVKGDGELEWTTMRHNYGRP